MSFNTDFRDLTDTFNADINKKMRTLNWVSVINGYYNGRNDTYHIGYRINGESFPVILTLKMFFPWSFHEWGGRSYPAEEFGDYEGGGFLSFDKKFNFELMVDPKFFEALGSNMVGFRAEPDEFTDIEPEKFTLDLTHKEKRIDKFTKKETKELVKWLEKAVPKITERIEKQIEIQVGRRLDEIMKVNEELALKYAPEGVKDMFIF